MRTLSQSVRKWRKIYLSPVIVQHRVLRDIDTIEANVCLQKLFYMKFY